MTAPASDPASGGSAQVGFRPGDVIAEKYRVERVLGVGGMGVVLAVTHLSLGEPYAIKYLTGHAAMDPAAIARFLAEARAAVRIKSEHVVRVSDVGQLPNGSPYILMEQLKGCDLGEVLADHGPMQIETAVDYVLQACVGIAEAHALGVVHRDLKPSNLFLTQRLDGTPLVKVLDFGIAKATNDPTQSAVKTATDAVFGSPAYMSPEQIRSARNVDTRTDIWSLGVILHELLAAELPFKAETVGGLLAAVAADPAADVRKRRTDVPDELAEILLRCLEKDLTKRFQTISELATALAPFRSAESLASVGRIQRLSKPAGALPHLSGYSRERLAVASTGRAWATTSPESTGGTAQLPARGGLRPWAILGAGAGVALLVVAGFVLRARAHRADVPATEVARPAAASVSAPPNDPPAIAPSATAPVAAPVPTTTASAAPAPGAAKAKQPERKPGVAAAPRPTASPAPSPARPAAPPASTGAPVDPTADSH